MLGWASGLRFAPNTLAEFQWAKSPSWALHTSVLQNRQDSAIDASAIDNVPGAFLLSNVLSACECKELISGTEGLGFDGSGDDGKGGRLPLIMPIDKATTMRTCGQCVVLVPETMVAELASRLSRHMPDGTGPIHINRRFRFYRYQPPGDTPVAEAQSFRPHLDGAQVKSNVLLRWWRARGLLVEARPRRVSSFSVLLYLNDCGFEGGEMAFLSRSLPSRELELRATINPQLGAAVVFHHGSSPLSPLHEGKMLLGGSTAPKYVARTDVYVGEV